MIYFTSDHHFDHKNIIRYCNRPFDSVDEMNSEMIGRWNSTVGLNDIVYYLGDFTLSKRAVEQYVPLLNGEKHLIMGNHDLCHPCHKKKAEAGRQLFLRSGFASIQLETSMEISGQTVLLNHMPYAVVQEGPDSYDLKYKQFRPKNEGLWLLHGHVHEKWRLKDRMINVGVDVWDFYPVSLAQIESHVKNDLFG